MFPPACYPKAATRSGGSSPPAFSRTAWIDNGGLLGGSDLTGAINNPSAPFLTPDAAITAMAQDGTDSPCTLIFLSDSADVITSNPDWDALLLQGVALESDAEGVQRQLSTVSFGFSPDSLLTLEDVVITLLVKDGNTQNAARSAGVVTGVGSVLITSCQCNSSDTSPDEAAVGDAGGVDDRSSFTAGPGITGPSSTASDGEAGENAVANGSQGATGTGAPYAWSITFAGVGTVSSITCDAVAMGGKGGRGGSGGTAIGGKGGQGGFCTDDVGRNGGPGGSATANGGTGGTGGRGGNGGIIHEGSWLIDSWSVNSSSGGGGGDGGFSGSATGGQGGDAGDGALGPGNAGNVGPTTQDTGPTGNGGANGTAGNKVT